MAYNFDTVNNLPSDEVKSKKIANDIGFLIVPYYSPKTGTIERGIPSISPQKLLIITFGFYSFCLKTYKHFILNKRLPSTFDFDILCSISIRRSLYFAFQLVPFPTFTFMPYSSSRKCSRPFLDSSSLKDTGSGIRESGDEWEIIPV